MKKLLALTVAATALFATRASAAGNLDEKYFTVDQNSVMIEDITDKGGTLPGTSPVPATDTIPKPPSGPQINPPLGGGAPGAAANPLDAINGTIGVIDNIVNLAEKIFDIIAKNQPVVNIKVNYANAVPFGYSHWTQMQGWSKPATKKYEFSMQNAYGGNVVKVVYQVHWVHSGNYQGKGKFLTGVTIEPLSVTTAWGYNVDLTAEVPDLTIANVGTSADPIASMQVKLKWKVHTILKDIQQEAIYYVQGDGQMEPIGTPFTRALEKKNQIKMNEVTEQVSGARFN